jgi:hypothetical protein
MDKDEAQKQEPVRAWFTADEFVEMADRRTKEWAKQEQGEPVAAESKFDIQIRWGPCSIEHHNLVQSEPHKWPGYQTRLLYTTPPQRTWVGLTDEEKQEWVELMPDEPKPRHIMNLINVIEVELKEKNT